jgi:enoyl-CoA hydratase/carnithine racemase
VFEPSRRDVTMFSVGELHEQFAAGLLPERFGALDDEPVLFVDLDDANVDYRLDPLLHQRPVVIVGVTKCELTTSKLGEGELRDFDVLLCTVQNPQSPWVGCTDLNDAITALNDSINQSKEAAVSLVQLLRIATSLDISDALTAESFVYSMLQSGARHQKWLASQRQRSRPVETDQAVIVDRFGDRLVITLNRPRVHNAFSARMRDELVAAFELAGVDLSVTEVVLRGTGESFCSGGDLGEFGTADDPASAHIVRTTASAARAMLPCRNRTTVLVQGACAGAGIEVAAFAHRVVASQGARFFLPEVSMGLIPGAGGTVSVPRRIGRQRAAFMAISGESVSAQTALEWGLVDVIDDFLKAGDQLGWK